MRVVICEPGKLARIEEIGDTMAAAQHVVGGDYATIPISLMSGHVIVCNAGADWLFWNPCRVLRGVLDSGEDTEVIFGTFFICRRDETGAFVGLSKNRAERYAEFFRFPERFKFENGRTNTHDDTEPQGISFDGVKITVTPFDPGEEKKNSILNRAIEKCSKDEEGRRSLPEYIAQEIIDRRFKEPEERFRAQIVEALEYLTEYNY